MAENAIEKVREAELNADEALNQANRKAQEIVDEAQKKAKHLQITAEDEAEDAANRQIGNAQQASRATLDEDAKALTGELQALEQLAIKNRPVAVQKILDFLTQS